MNFIFCKLKKPQKTWISFFCKLKKPKKTWISFFATLKNFKKYEFHFFASFDLAKSCSRNFCCNEGQEESLEQRRPQYQVNGNYPGGQSKGKTEEKGVYGNLKIYIVSLCHDVYINFVQILQKQLTLHIRKIATYRPSCRTSGGRPRCVCKNFLQA